MTGLRTLVIAEAGVNHNGHLALARQLVDAAAEAGADYVKFQTFKADRLVTADAPMAEYQTERACHEGQLEMLQGLELSEEAHLELRDHCASCGIGFLSTGFDVDSLRFLVRLGIDRVKVPSGEITNLPYLRTVGGLGLPVIVSTGMATMDEIRDALFALQEAGCSRDRVTVLQCTTAYPTPFAEANLRAMRTIRAAFGVSVGFSDHTLGTEASIAAVALGATVIEKHLTLNRALPGPDHFASSEPDEFEYLIRAIRNVEDALGDGLKRPTATELENVTAARKSLVASTSIERGERLGAHNIVPMRPGDGVSPMRWDDVMGTEARRAYSPGERIEL